MKYIVAVIQPFKLSEVSSALLEISEFPGMTVTRVEGFGQGRARSKAAGHEPLTDFVPKIKVECAVKDSMASAVTEVIMRQAHTGNKGDGKIFVFELPCVSRIRTGEHDDECLWSPTGG